MQSLLIPKVHGKVRCRLDSGCAIAEETREILIERANCFSVQLDLTECRHKLAVSTQSIEHKTRMREFSKLLSQIIPGEGTSLWVRRGCAPVLGSFWPENSGIGVSFYWKISVIGVYFHSEFSGIGDYSKFCNGC